MTRDVECHKEQQGKYPNIDNNNYTKMIQNLHPYGTKHLHSVHSQI